MRSVVVVIVGLVGLVAVAGLSLPGCYVLGLSPLPCVDDGDCVGEDRCDGTTCVAPGPDGEGEGDVGEGEGEGDVGEGEGEGDAGEGEGEGDAGEGEGDVGEGEGEGDVGEGEGEGEPAGPRCGDGEINGIDVCDDRNTIGGDGCSTHCEIEIDRCGIKVPPLFAEASAAIVSPNANNDAGCFTTVADAQATNGGGAVGLLYLDEGIHQLATFPLVVDIALAGASALQVSFGSPDVTDQHILTLRAGATLVDATVVGGRDTSGADLVEIGFAGTSNTTTIIGATLRGPGDLVFINGGPDQLIIDDVRFEAASTVTTGLFSGSSTTSTVITVQNSVFDKSDIAVNAAARLIFLNNVVNVVGNSLNTFFLGGGRPASVRDNRFFSEGACQFGLDLEDGDFALSGNRFEGFQGGSCVALKVESTTVALKETGQPANTFSNNRVDVRVNGTVVIDARGNNWSFADPCDGVEFDPTLGPPTRVEVSDTNFCVP